MLLPCKASPCIVRNYFCRKFLELTRYSDWIIGADDEIKNKAKANKKTVVLPETTDMRTLTAAAEVISEGIADIILVGKEDEIKAKAGPSSATCAF